MLELILFIAIAGPQSGPQAGTTSTGTTSAGTTSAGARAGSGASGAAAPAGASAPPDWRTLEAPMLADHVQLTFPDRFAKAGESYFSPDGSMIVFQATEVAEDGKPVEDFYGMFVADVRREGDRIAGIENIRRISPEGSANTCGWFHPTAPGVVIFASTIGPPTASEPPGYQRGSGRYRWMFPPEMRIVSVDLARADGTTGSLETIVPHAGAYMAECSVSPDGRHLLYCSLESNQGDLFILDTATGTPRRIVGAPGYDGGPFFSPDGRRICWRSDREGNNLLQLFVADLVFDEDGAIVGIGREHQLTNDEHVNWCPFWTTDGKLLAFASSRVGHRNYEVFVVDADPGDLASSQGGAEPAAPGPVRYGTNLRRVTFAEGADVLPAFSPDGRWMIWTAQRGPERSSQLWAARWLPAGG